ncbi:MAG: hypothetical protein K0S32_2588 [Bacteroidetes bacterium]|nr:hypothetical protein [Bacteroidota bacterium]
MLFVLPIAAKVSSQCQCGGASMMMLGENTNGSVSLKRNSWMVESGGEYRYFNSPEVATHTHSHSGSVPSHTHTAEDTAQTKLNHAWMGSLNIRYGVTGRLTLSVQQPYVWLTATPKDAGGRGDLLFFATYKFLDRNDFSAAILGGVKLPLGTRSDLGNESQLMIGTGSYDPVTGINLALSKPKIILRATAFYKYAGTGYNDTKYGNFFNHTVSFTYKVKDGSACTSDSVRKIPMSCSVFTSLSGELYGRQSTNDVVSAETGGYLLLAGAGIQFGNRKWSFPLGASFNVYQRMHSEENSNKLRVRLAVIRSF